MLRDLLRDCLVGSVILTFSPRGKPLNARGARTVLKRTLIVLNRLLLRIVAHDHRYILSFVLHGINLLLLLSGKSTPLGARRRIWDQTCFLFSIQEKK